MHPRRHATTNRTRALLAAAVTALGTAVPAPPASAQSAGFKLDESGRWVQVSGPTAGTDEALVAEARAALANDRPSAALSLLDPFIEQYQRSSNPLLAQAYLLRGDALTASGSEYQALYDYEAVSKQFPATDEFVRAAERELDIGVRYVNGMRRKFLGVRILSAEDIGEELLIRVQERLPASRLAERAGIELGDYYFRERDMALAAEAYGLFLDNYPKSSYFMKAMKRRVYATIARFKGPEYDATPLLDAQSLIRRFTSLYPAEAQQAGLDDALVARLDDSAAAEMYETANWYMRTGDEVSARYTLKRLIARHPRTGAASASLREMTDRGWLDPAVAPATPTAASATSAGPPEPGAEPASPVPPSTPAPAATPSTPRPADSSPPGQPRRSGTLRH